MLCLTLEARLPTTKMLLLTNKMLRLLMIERGIEKYTDQNLIKNKKLLILKLYLTIETRQPILISF